MERLSTIKIGDQVPLAWLLASSRNGNVEADFSDPLDAIGAHTLWLRLDPTNQHHPEPLVLTVRTVASRETLRLFHSGHVVRAGTEGFVTALYLTNLPGTKDGWELPGWCHQPTTDRWVAVLLENGFYTSVRAT